MERSQYMKAAIEEAKVSLREGDNGFGAVIIKDGKIISAAHDKEENEYDPASHAESNAIKEAVRKLGKNLEGCILLSTHEPCPACYTAAVCSGIAEFAFGYSSKEAMQQGREQMELTCDEMVNGAHTAIRIQEGILHQECSILYREEVRAEIKKLRNATAETFEELSADSIKRRVTWYNENHGTFEFINDDIVDSGYNLLLTRLGITENEAPIMKRTEQEIVFHSKNFCPTLEACKILKLDTRDICKKMNEKSTDMLLKRMNCQLGFSRNYEKLRPYTDYCEERIRIEAKRSD